MVPTIVVSKPPPLGGIDLIHQDAENLRMRNQQMKEKEGEKEGGMSERVVEKEKEIQGGEKKKEEKKKAEKPKKSIKIKARKGKGEDMNDEPELSGDDPNPKPPTQTSKPDKGKGIAEPSQTSKPLTVENPFQNRHGEPIQPKDEPIEFHWEDFNLPNLNIPIYKEKKKRQSKPKFTLPSLRINQPAPKPSNKDDRVYIADIKEFGALDLHMSKVDEVKALPATERLPDRLMFCYKGGGNSQWPLLRVLKESYDVLTKVFSAMKRGGYTEKVKSDVLRKIEQIRQSWKDPEALPRVLELPKTGERIHMLPYWLMEFRDDNGTRRFFRLEDQLKIASNETLLEMQSNLDLENADEAEFNIQLQQQIEENNRKLGKKTREPRKKK